MSELQIIQSALQGAARRRRWAQALRGLWIGLLVGAIICLLLIGAYRLLPLFNLQLPSWVVLAAATVPIPFAIAGLIIGGWRKAPLSQVARWVDGRQQLKERLSTALEVADDTTANTWGQLVVADAAQHVKEIDARKLVPFHLPNGLRWAVIALAFNPVRERARHLANHLVYGKRASPYEVLSEFSERMAGTYSLEDVLPRMATILGEGTGAALCLPMLDAAGAILREMATFASARVSGRACA